MPHRLSHLARAALLTLAIMGACASAHAADPTVQPLDAVAVRDYDLPAGPLGRTISAFAVGAGIALAFDPALTDGLENPRVSGRLAARDAVQRLLAGSGLEIALRSDNSYTLRKQPPAPSGAEATLPEVKVRAAREPETATGPVQGFVARRSATATKTDTPLLEIPQSISVITRDELVARDVNLMIEALRYVPGVSTSVYGQDDRGWEWFNIRGFSDGYSANYLDGLRQVGINYTAPQNEPKGLERIEVLRGPSSVLFGQGDAGGVVSRISKRPRADAVNEVEAQLGNYGRRQLAADLGGSLDADAGVHWRLVAVGTGVRPQIDYPGVDEKSTRRQYLAPSLAWNPSPGTSLVLLSDYLHIRSTSNATEYLGTDHVRTGVLAYDPAYDLHEQHQWSVGYQFEHRVDSTWTVRQNLRTARTTIDLNAVLGDNGTADAAGDIPRYALRFDEATRYTVVDTQLLGRFRIGEAEHSTLAGVDWLTMRSDSLRHVGTAPTLNLYDPVYGRPVDEPDTPIADGTDRQRQLGMYLQDQIKWGDWRFTGGLRRDRVRTGRDDRLAATSSSVTESATTARAGVTYLHGSGWAPYASYTESFMPEAGADAAGNTFRPTRGRQFEVGAKYQPADGHGMVAIALFDLTKSHVLTRDPVNQYFSIQNGERHSRGVELEVKQRLSPSWSVLAQYTHLDARITEDSDNAGRRAPDVARDLASAWVDYKATDGSWRGVGAGLGVRHVGRTFIDAENTLSNPARTLVDAVLSYDATAWRFTLSANNLLDKDYLAHTTYGYRGSRRTLAASLKYRF